MKKDEATWVACAIDSEGSITWQGKPWRKVAAVRVYNTNLEYINRFSKLTGSTVHVQVSRGKGTRTLYAAALSRRDKVKQLLEEIEEYLIIKKPMAREVLEWFANNPVLKRGRPRPGYVTLKREWQKLSR